MIFKKKQDAAVQQTAAGEAKPAAKGGKAAAFFRKNWKWMVPVVCVAVLGGWLILRPDKAQNANTDINYVQVSPSKRDVSNTLSGTGTLNPANTYNVKSLVAGKVLTSSFEEGDIVEEGTVLYTVDSSDATTKAEQASIALQQAQRSYDKTADRQYVRAEVAGVVSAEDYFAALAKPLALDADGAGDEEEQPTRDPHTLAVGFLLRLRRTGWLEEQPGSYEGEASLAFVPEVTPLLEALEEILNPRVVTYTGKLYKAWQLLGSIGQEKSPYENVLREVDADLDALNRSLRALNASIGHYIDRLTRNRTPQEVLELFDQYEEKVVAAAYHRFKTSDNLFNYRAYLEEELDDCEENYLPQLAFDYARVERCAPGEAAPRVKALLQKQRDALEEMSLLMREIDSSHIRYRKRAVQRAQFLLLSDRSSQGSVTALLRRYAEDIRTPEQLFEPDDGPVAKRLHLYPAAVFGEKFLYPPAAQRTAEPLAPVRTEAFDPEQLRKEQQLLLDYARLAVTEENVALLARQALAARPSVNAAVLADEYPHDFARIIGLHTYSQSPHREYDITLTGNWVERGGFRFEDFVLTRRKEEEDGNH